MHVGVAENASLRQGRAAAARRLSAVVAALALSASALASNEPPGPVGPNCEGLARGEAAYIVCRFDPKTDDIRLFHSRSDGEPWRHFGRLADALAKNGERLVFAMNAGMYQTNRAPVGLYVEEGVMRRPVNNRDCKGNFCLKPNGVFLIWAEDGYRGAHVMTTDGYRDRMAHDVVAYATQSGPMLVIDGAIHPKFLKDSTSRYRRNGVGVTTDGEVVFAISDTPVTFHEFATFFRDALHCRNALYFDGKISRLYAPEFGRNEPGAAMGPIVGVVEPTSPKGRESR